MKPSRQTIENLKAFGDHFAAGKMARKYDLGANYGCHYGMASTRHAAMAAYKAGYDAPITPTH